MSQHNQMREVRPMDKLSSRLYEIQHGVRAGEVIAGRGIKVTRTPSGVIVDADTSFADETGATSEQTTIPCWG